jgi:hypothetical protein
VNWHAREVFLWTALTPGTRGAAASPTSTKAIARPAAPELRRSGDQPDDAGSLRLQLHAALKADDPDDGVGACGQVAHQDVEPAALARGPELRRTARNGVGHGSSELRGGLLLAYGAAADVSLAGLSCGRRRNAATAARPSARVPMPVMPVPIAATAIHVSEPPADTYLVTVGAGVTATDLRLAPTVTVTVGTG